MTYYVLHLPTHVSSIDGEYRQVLLIKGNTVNHKSLDIRVTVNDYGSDFKIIIIYTIINYHENYVTELPSRHLIKDKFNFLPLTLIFHSIRTMLMCEFIIYYCFCVCLICLQFATHFEIYEQHCALEKINLTNLNRAMSNPDFMAYLKVCAFDYRY